MTNFDARIKLLIELYSLKMKEDLHTGKAILRDSKFDEDNPSCHVTSIAKLSTEPWSGH